MSSVLLYTGGLDSELVRLCQLTPPSTDLLWANLGTQGCEAEAKRHKVPVRTVNLSWVASHEEADGWVPARNLLLVTTAAVMGYTDIALAALKGEGSRDKTGAFFRQASGLLSYIVGRRVRVYSPVGGMTKGELIALALRKGVSAEAITGTMSCYQPVNGLHCGRCRACWRRWVALDINGLTQPWDREPSGFNPAKGTTARKLWGQLHLGALLSPGNLDALRVVIRSRRTDNSAAGGADAPLP